MGNPSKHKEVDIRNRKADHLYFIVDTIETGIMLSGSEVKSIRAGQANLKEAYCIFRKGELYVKGMHISVYKQASVYNHEPLTLRKLLLHKRELDKLQKRMKEKGLTIIPYRLYTNERNIIKLEIAIAKGKRKHDKRESIKAKDNRRELDRLKKFT